MHFLRFLEFTFFSSLEYIAIFLLMFALFRFRVYRSYIAKMAVVCLVLSYFDYTMRTVYDLASLSVLIQLLIWIVFLALLFQIHIFYASVMAITANTFYFSIQYALLSILQWTGILAYEKIFYIFPMVDVLPFLSALLAVLFSREIRTKNWGFAFVPDSANIKVKFNVENLMFFLFLAIAFITDVCLVVLFYKGHSNTLINTVISVLVVLPLIYLAVKREQNDD